MHVCVCVSDNELESDEDNVDEESRQYMEHLSKKV